IDDLGGCDYNRLAREACARHTGIGADGLLVLKQSDHADFGLRFFNSDGSEAEMSGNGICCAAAALYHSARTDSSQLRFSTLSGEKMITLRNRKDSHFDFEVSMGKPIFLPKEIPIIIPDDRERVIQYPLV